MRDLFLLALLNSKLAYFYFHTVCAGLEGKNEIYLRFFGQYLEGFPVVTVGKRDVAQASRRAEVSKLAEAMLESTQRLASARTDKDRDFYLHKCDALDRRIDGLVFEMYGLSSEEIEVVEETSANRSSDQEPVDETGAPSV